MKKLLTLILTFIISAPLLMSQTDENKKSLPTLNEIMEIMKKSEIAYTSQVEDNFTSGDKKELTTLNDQLYVKFDGGNPTLMKYELSSEGNETLNQAEAAYNAKDYDKAIGLYSKVLESDKDYNKIFTMIGDIYYEKQNYDSAKYFLNLAIEKNPVDYTAHWFLADTYFLEGNMEGALKEIILAHLLNRNHKDIHDIMKVYRNAAGRKWNDWEAVPQCTTYKEGNNVVIKSTKEWLGYACAEAVWKYEPGFAEGIVGKGYDVNNSIYEKESTCMAAFLDSNTNEVINGIVNDGYFQEMVWYEVISKQVPGSLLLIPQDFFSRIVEYVNKYH